MAKSMNCLQYFFLGQILSTEDIVLPFLVAAHKDEVSTNKDSNDNGTTQSLPD